jgi:hypothetical protein
MIRPIYIGQLSGKSVRFFRPLHDQDGLYPWTAGEDMIKALCRSDASRAAGREMIGKAPKRFPDLSRRIGTVSGFVTVLSFSAQKGSIDSLVEIGDIGKSHGMAWLGLLNAAARDLYPDMWALDDEGNHRLDSVSLSRLMGVDHATILHDIHRMDTGSRN